jgi:hypothetical protein
VLKEKSEVMCILNEELAINLNPLKEKIYERNLKELSTKIIQAEFKSA